MRLTIAVYVTVEKNEGSAIHVCRPVMIPALQTRDVLLNVAMQRLANKSRQHLHTLVEKGHAEEICNWLYDPEATTTKLKIGITLRDRTLSWRLLMVTRQVFDRYVAYSPSLPDLWFELQNLEELESRATEVYTRWCQESLQDNPSEPLPEMMLQGDAWIEPLDLDLSSLERKKRKRPGSLAAMFGTAKMRGDEELRKVGRCLDDVASEYQSAIGRNEIVEHLERLLRREDRQPILLVGASGAGKTAIIEDCIARRATLRKQKNIGGEQTWWISPQRLISGMSYLGQWEERWLAILREATRKDHILYIDDLLGLVTAGVTRDSRLCAADVLKSYLGQHPLRLLSETTPETLSVLRRRDRGLADFFHILPVSSMDEAASLDVLYRVVAQIEADRHLYFHPSVLPSILEKQRSFAPHRSFPGKAVEVIRNLARIEGNQIQLSHLYQYFRERTGVAMRMLHRPYASQEPLRALLEQRLVGQPEALDAVEKVAIRACNRLAPEDRPLGVLLFLGPTGVGKTECAKTLNAALFEDESHLLRFDMNEITTSLQAEQLIGTFDSPDGRLTAAVRRRPFSVLLFDEIEKAHPDVLDYLLQVLGEGRLTDSLGRTNDFRNTVIIMTSNLGVQEDQAGLGFETVRGRAQNYLRSAKRFFRPEFFNRIDEVIPFRRLERKDISKIAQLQLDQLLRRDGLIRRDVYVRAQPTVLEWLVDRGYHPELGARAMKRALESHFVQPLCDLLAASQVDSAVWIDVGLVDSTSSSANPSLASRALGSDLEDAYSRRKEVGGSYAVVSGPIRCRIQPLSIVTARPSIDARSPEDWIARADALVQQFGDQLHGLQSSLSGSDANSKVRYYSVHEHVFECRERLKAYKEYVRTPSSQGIRPMQTNPAVVKRNAGQRSVSTRRFMVDYQSELDIREAISESDPKDQFRNQLDPLEQLTMSLRITQTMIEFVNAPTRWMFGLRFASQVPHEIVIPDAYSAVASPADSLQSSAAEFVVWDPNLHPATSWLVHWPIPCELPSITKLKNSTKISFASSSRVLPFWDS